MSQQYRNSTTLIQSYSSQHWFISKGCNEYEYNLDIKLITFQICLIHTPTHTDPTDSTHSSKFTVLVVTFTKKKGRNRFFAIHKYSWNFEYKWVNNIEIQLVWFNLTYYSVGCNEYEYNLVIKVLTFEICLIQTPTTIVCFADDVATV